MNYWLFKSDPEAYNFADLERDRQTRWDGVTNNLALKNLQNCKKGDRVIVYHSGEEKSLIGLAEIIREAYPDPKQKDPKLVVVDIKAVRRIKRPITLADVKARKEFADFPLVRMPRLSVMPVTSTQWNSLMKLTGER